MFIHQEPPPPREEILKLERYLDELEPAHPPLNPTEDNPLDINHFAQLDKLAHRWQGQAADEVMQLRRHYLNACRQVCAAERYIAKLEGDISKVKAMVDDLERRMSEVESSDGEIEESAPEIGGVPI